ncbi:putative Transposon TX1 [Gossypium australe]|uniref:Putative Transposon TX1 n=1 Tax=Gossypium australe TaxID=47621 RepID=A0A5B6VZJ1_9ROSI|nr:putative Transposon TX1 [Gossypium australe]
MSKSIGKLTHELKDWTKYVYGYITTRKRDLIKRIANIQRKRDLSVDLSLCQELEDALHHEELLWKQKARCDWLKLGDQNTNPYSYSAKEEK